MLRSALLQYGLAHGLKAGRHFNRGESFAEHDSKTKFCFLASLRLGALLNLTLGMQNCIKI